MGLFRLKKAIRGRLWVSWVCLSRFSCCLRRLLLALRRKQAEAHLATREIAENHQLSEGTTRAIGLELHQPCLISVAQGTSMATWSCSNMPPGDGGAPGHPKGRETAPTHTTLRAHHLTCFRSEHRPIGLDSRHSSPRSRPSHPTTMEPCSHMSRRPLGDTRPPPRA